jgi:ariadne-1
MEDMQQNSDLSWIEVQFLKKAVDITVQCRTTLKWTYAFAFYLDKSNHTELFEVRIGLPNDFTYNNNNNNK